MKMRNNQQKYEKIKTTYIDTKGGKKEKNKITRKIPILLIGGLGICMLEWENFIKKISENARIIVYERPANAYTKNIPDNITNDLYLQIFALKKTIDELKIKKTIIIAHSMGGFIAEAFARIYPEYCEKIILLDPSCEKQKIRKNINTKMLLVKNRKKHATNKHYQKYFQEKNNYSINIFINKYFTKKIEKIYETKPIATIFAFLCTMLKIKYKTKNILLNNKSKTIKNHIKNKIKIFTKLTLTSYKTYKSYYKLCLKNQFIKKIIKENKNYKIWEKNLIEIKKKNKIKTPTIIIGAYISKNTYANKKWINLLYEKYNQMRAENKNLNIKFIKINSTHLLMHNMNKKLLSLLEKEIQ